MSDLSKLLDDVYRSGSSTPAAPSWSSDSALDEVFSDWVPGESEGASPVEQAFAEFAAEPAPLPMPDETMDQLDALVQAAVAMAPSSDHVEDEDDVEVPQALDVALPVVAEASPVESHAEALRWTPERSPEPIAPAEPVAPAHAFTPWNREDDDILPRRGRGGRGKLTLRRR